MPETISSSAHGGDEVRVRIDGHQLHGAGNAAADSGSEYLARTDVKHFAEDPEWEKAHDQRRVHKALMIRRKNEWPVARNVLQATDLDSVQRLT